MSETVYRTWINGLAIACVLAALAGPVIGNYTECLCNLNHALCVDRKCATDTTCQRLATISKNRVVESDDMFCSKNGTFDLVCDYAERYGDIIAVRFCCEDPHCNGNDTYMYELITTRLGEGASDLLHSIVTPSITTTARLTSTDIPASDNEKSNETYNSTVWIIIILLTMLFIALQIVCVTITLIVGCRKLK